MSDVDIEKVENSAEAQERSFSVLQTRQSFNIRPIKFLRYLVLNPVQEMVRSLYLEYLILVWKL